MKKKIDSLFKNGLDRPQKAPGEAWDYIRDRIPSEDDDRFIPFWKKSLGIGLLLIGLTGAGLMISENNWFSIQNSRQNQNTPATGRLSGHSDAESKPNQTEAQNLLTRTGRDNYSNLNTAGNSYLSETGSGSNNRNENNGFAYSDSRPNPQFCPDEPAYQNKKANSFTEILTQNYPHTATIQKNLIAEFNLVSLSELSGLIYLKSEAEIAAQNSKEHKQHEKKMKPKMDFDKFFISGFVSPTGLNTFVGASMLSDNLNNYKTENSITLAYGLKAAYALSPKLKIRAGFSVIGFEQITKNVMMTTGFSDQPFTIAGTGNNINYSGDLRIYNPAEDGEFSYRFSDGDVRQQSQFLEIPVEAELSVFHSGSIGISVTGGGSAWLLSKNRIYAHTDGHTEELGKANNLNKTSFSANTGVKLEMKISDDVQLNVEPNFKYLINPVSNIQKYSPYTVGVNAGVTVRLK